MSQTQMNFIKQQGFTDVSSDTCPLRYPPLMFQPRVIGVLVLAGALLRWAPLFLALTAVLLWSAFVPGLNPFERVYNRFIAPGRRVLPLTPAPRPRRFAQFLAATLTLTSGVSLLKGWTLLAWAAAGLLLLAVAAILMGSFCLGSFVFHLITGNAAHARRTMPWARSAR